MTFKKGVYNLLMKKIYNFFISAYSVLRLNFLGSVTNRKTFNAKFIAPLEAYSTIVLGTREGQRERNKLRVTHISVDPKWNICNQYYLELVPYSVCFQQELVR